MNNYYNPVRLIVGRGSRKSILEDLKSNLNIAIISSLRGRKQFQSDPYLKNILDYKNITWVDSVLPNPDIYDLNSTIKSLKDFNINKIIGIGGGSALDFAKATAFILSNIGINCDLLEFIQRPSLMIGLKSLPTVLIPTTSGTGSEVTPFATIWDHENKRKLSLSGEAIFPYQAIVDSELTEALPLDQTIYTGLDAINQAMESICNRNSNGITFSLAARAIKIGIEFLPKICEKPENRLYREKMSECSLLSGLAISQTRTAICHSISYPLTAHYGVPHGLACAFTMLSVIKINLQKEDLRFNQLKEFLGVDCLKEVFKELNIIFNITEKTKKYIPNEDALTQLVDEMYTPDRASNSLIKIDRNMIISIIKDAWDTC